MSRPPLTRIMVILAGLLLAGCAEQPSLKSRSFARADFSGSWEMDYQSSDRINERLRGLYHEIQRAQERRPAASDINIGATQRAERAVGMIDQRSAQGVVDLARLADLITGGQLLEIEQSRGGITIKREDTFNLHCVFADGDAEAEAIEGSLGSEICGWDAHQLVFNIFLPDGLAITHRLSIASNREKLNIATTVRSARSGYPFYTKPRLPEVRSV